MADKAKPPDWNGAPGFIYTDQAGVTWESCLKSIPRHTLVTDTCVRIVGLSRMAAADIAHALIRDTECTDVWLEALPVETEWVRVEDGVS